MTDTIETAAYDIRASLLIADFDCDPDEVSEHLGLRPAHVARRNGHSLLAWRTTDGPARNEWLFRPAVELPEPRPRHVGLGDVLRPLRRVLEARRDRLATLPRCSSEIRIEVLPHGATPDIAVAAGDFDFLTRLGLSFSIDIRTAVTAA